MRNSSKQCAKSLAFSLVVVLAFFALHVLFAPTARAASSIVVNEIMYNPGTGNQLDEFVELYNPSANSLDISGWCFTEGVTLCFSSGTVIAGESYELISPDSAQTLATYTKTTIGTYTGALSNGGETLTLRDSSNSIVVSMTYDDASPWPLSPDGSGHSLELKNPTLAESDVANWGGSMQPGGTPGAINSLVDLALPVISGANRLENVQPSVAQLVTATVSDAVVVELVYKRNFEADVTIAMHDDGAHDDGAADDGVYGANIPGMDAGELVRYRIVATNPSGASSLPANDESIDYYGYVVVDPLLESSTPILQWFIDDNDYAALLATPDGEETYFPAVIAYGNNVYDNSRIRLKGEYSRTLAKKPFKVKLPSGYQIEMPGVLEYPLNEFHLNADFAASNNYIVSLTSWRVFEYAGFPVPQVKKVQLQRNGAFEGAYTLAEKYDKEWLSRSPIYSGDDIFEDFYEVVQAQSDNNSSLVQLQSNLNNLSGDARRRYALDNLDIANVINFMAVSAVIRSHDWSGMSNLMSHHDIDGTDRWSFLPWDLDLTFSNIGLTQQEALQGYGYMIDPYDSVDYVTPEQRFFATVIWDDPELQSMYKRRIRTLVDEIYANGLLESWIDDEFSIARDAANLDYLKWYDYEDARLDEVRNIMISVGLDPDDPDDAALFYSNVLGFDLSGMPDALGGVAPLTPDNRIHTLKEQAQLQLNKFNTDYVQQGLIPGSQMQNRVIINEIMYRPSTNDNLEYIELYNPTDEAIDLSNWRFTSGVTIQLPGGSVIPAQGYATIVKDDVAFRSHYDGGTLVLGEYSGNLANEGETLTLVRSDDSLASTVTYGISEPWVSEANGGGSSLGLYSPDADTSRAYCWGRSVTSDGTPGGPNTFSQTWQDKYAYLCAPVLANVVTSVNSLPTFAGVYSGARLADIIAVSADNDPLDDRSTPGVSRDQAGTKDKSTIVPRATFSAWGVFGWVALGAVALGGIWFAFRATLGARQAIRHK